MKRIAFIVTALLINVSLFAGKGIVVEQNITSSTGLISKANFTWYITEGACKLKLKLPENQITGSTYFIPDTKNGKLLTYGDSPTAKKTYFAIPASSIKPDDKMDLSGLAVTKTEETKEISGFTCEKYVVKTTTTETEMWVTKDFKIDFYKFYPFFRTSYEMTALSQGKIKGVPLVSTTKDLNGKVIGSMELISAAKADIKEADLQVPADYTLAVTK